MARFSLWLSAAAWLLVAVVPVFAAGSDGVWALRTRFTVTMSEADLDYAEDDGQWRIMFRDGQIAANDVGFAVELGDGRVLRNTDLTHDVTDRSAIETPFGPGTCCHVLFKEKDGVVVEHSLTLFKSRPFVLLGMAVTNASDAPVTVTRFVPVLAGAGQFAGLGPSTEMTRYPLRIRGGEPVFDPEGPPAWTRFDDPATGRAVAIGLLPTGDMEGGADFRAVGDAWEGEVFFDHSPGVKLAPGERVETGMVWLAIGASAPEQMALNYGWAYTMGRTSGKQANLPRAWVTIPDEQGLSDLLKTARAHQPGIRCALIPANWEGRPGSMRGAAPGYPGDMGSAASQLSAMKMTPGITIDPLAGDGGKQDWIVKSATGQAWLNPAHPEAAELIRKRVDRAIRWGFQFIAVAPSAIPDEALQAMNLTRARANVLALGLAREAAGNAPVVMAGSGISATDIKAWRGAADAVKSMTDYGATPAAMRLNADALAGLTEEDSAALRDWAGPIEVIGTGKSDLRRLLERNVFAERGGPALRIRPAEEEEEELVEAVVAAEDVAEENGEPVVLEDEQAKEPAEGRGFIRGIKNLGHSIF